MARKLQVDRWLFAATAGLALFGVVMVYSASAVMAEQENHNQYYYVIKQGVWTGIGFLAMLGAMRFDYQGLRNRRLVYGLMAMTALALLAVFAFPRINGAHRWIKLAGFSVQPSEAAKLAVTVFLAYFLEKRAGEERSFWWTFVPCIMMTGMFAVLVVAEPDLGTALMLAVICVVMCFTAGVRLLHLGTAAAPALVGVMGLLIFVPWRLQRMITFLDPWKDPRDKGFQVVQSLIAVGSGGVNGLGFAQGKQKLFFLPFAHSDFIFAVVGEELGLLGALTVVIVFAIFLWRGMRAALRAPDRFGMLLGLGLVTSIVAQALFNISVVLSLVPTKGIPLPFISYGGSSLVPTMIAAGILLNISQYSVSGGGGGGVGALTGGQQDGSARKTILRQPVPAPLQRFSMHRGADASPPVS
ncbi:MAG TPA: putative lipid II flippase FtsW [Pyrinomonadaceae bacterium]|jgi:cell division protein FtsW|nr:putative lipid II flippase FtsW [Pyrinomonadaceae bacterium]